MTSLTCVLCGEELTWGDDAHPTLCPDFKENSGVKPTIATVSTAKFDKAVELFKEFKAIGKVPTIREMIEVELCLLYNVVHESVSFNSNKKPRVLKTYL